MDKNEKSQIRRGNPHFNPELRDYVMDLWMNGTSVHVIERIVRKKMREFYESSKKNSKNVA